MISFRNLGKYPAGRPLTSDDIIEFHATRLLLLLAFCGVKGRIDGLTKLAKLDFFIRYPQFFETASAYLGGYSRSSTGTIESRMVRYRYGPWDKRYYDVLNYLKSKDLIAVTKPDRKLFQFHLTIKGKEVAEKVAEYTEFIDLVDQMRRVKELLGNKSGSALKKLIYDLFKKEVAEKALNEVI